MAYFQGEVPALNVGCCVDGAALDVAEELHDKTCRDCTMLRYHAKGSSHSVDFCKVYYMAMMMGENYSILGCHWALKYSTTLASCSSHFWHRVLMTLSAMILASSSAGLWPCTL